MHKHYKRKLLVFMICLLVCGFLKHNLWQTRQINTVSAPTSIGKKPCITYESPLIFVGGIPRTGTTLMRVILDAHPDIRCGPETMIIPNLLAFRKKMIQRFSTRFGAAGISNETMDIAFRNFILYIIKKHDKPARFLCNKDPLTANSAVYLSKLFPNSKFILMVRDGRALAHSLFLSNLVLDDFKTKDPVQVIQQWNKTMTDLFGQCVQIGRCINTYLKHLCPEKFSKVIGESRCFPMLYEKLVLAPEQQTKALFKFLGIPWHKRVLSHNKFVGNYTSIVWDELSSHQIVKPIYTDSLHRWANDFSHDFIERMKTLAPMLDFFGYDTLRKPPDYSLLLSLNKSYFHAFKKGHESMYHAMPSTSATSIKA